MITLYYAADFRRHCFSPPPLGFHFRRATLLMPPLTLLRHAACHYDCCIALLRFSPFRRYCHASRLLITIRRCH
jgi:hypothetical protein